MYCIYTDSDVPKELGNYDHVFPLSLGGNNQFTVWCAKSQNSVMGSEVDGAVVNDPVFKFPLRTSGLKGHGRNTHVPRWKRVTMNGRLYQVEYRLDRVVVWDVREKRELRPEEFVGKEMTATLKIEMHTAVRFLAKVALGGGHFLYGDRFRSAVDCAPLREVTFLDLEASKRSGVLAKSRITVADRFSPDSLNGGPAYFNRVLCESLRRSLFIAIPGRSSITFVVGIAGMFLGAIDIPADTSDFPIGGDHDLGHVLVLGPGKMNRVSYRTLVKDFDDAFKKSRELIPTQAGSIHKTISSTPRPKA